MIYDFSTLKLIKKIDQVSTIPLFVTKMVVAKENLAYILGKNIVTQSLVNESATKVISRQAKLVSIALSSDSKKLAVGDEFGKIYVLYNFMASKDPHNKLVIQSLPQWHSQSVNCLKFTQSD